MFSPSLSSLSALSLPLKLFVALLVASMIPVSGVIERMVLIVMTIVVLSALIQHHTQGKVGLAKFTEINIALAFAVPLILFAVDETKNPIAKSLGCAVGSFAIIKYLKIE